MHLVMCFYQLRFRLLTADKTQFGAVLVAPRIFGFSDVDCSYRVQS